MKKTVFLCIVLTSYIAHAGNETKLLSKKVKNEAIKRFGFFLTFVKQEPKARAALEEAFQMNLNGITMEFYKEINSLVNKFENGELSRKNFKQEARELLCPIPVIPNDGKPVAMIHKGHS